MLVYSHPNSNQNMFLIGMQINYSQQKKKSTEFMDLHYETIVITDDNATGVGPGVISAHTRVL